MLCLFPFETELYQRVGVSAVHVGHPLAELFPTERQADGARALFGLPLDIPVLALLPGSRIGEVERLAPVFLETAAQLKARIPRLITLAPMASNAVRRVLEPLLEPRHGVRLIDRQAHMVMRAADAALLASGTATLECALARTPMVVAYKVSKLTEWMVRLMGGLRTPWFSLPNHLEGGFVVPEFSQRDANPGVLSEALEPLFEPVHRAPQLAAFDRIQKVLRKDGNARAADAVLNLLFH
jgi:lipid-A-disaccharide synthase